MKKLAMFLALSVLLMAGGASAQNHPKIGGAVYGGGRMANVGGSTLVTVVNCDTIGAVYGGNDIAGSVQASSCANANGFNGTEVVIGVATGANHTTQPVRIGSVYGGGNGYYAYPAASGHSHTVATPGIAAGEVYEYDDEAGEGTAVATLPASTNVPTTLRTKVTVATDWPYIDFVFGGAKNAFITSTDPADTTTSVNIKSGTIYAVFGGNNYGGTIGANTFQHVVVSGTTTSTAAANASVNLGGVVNGATAFDGSACSGCATYPQHGSVAAHGIRYLFGGGNAVASQKVHMQITGGQIDTVYAGGNSASVTATTVDVNITNTLKPNYSEAYDREDTYYDIRCLFGGNNAAEMAVVPALNLSKGYVHTIYGGGNQGVMTGSETYTDNTGNASATRSTRVLLNSSDFRCDTVYGGGQSAGASYDTYVEMNKTSGEAETLHVGTIFGGTNISGEIAATAKSNVLISNGTVHQAVFGGSNGYYRCNSAGYYGDSWPADADHDRVASGDRTPYIWNTNVKITDGNILGNVYGGGNLVPVSLEGNATNATVKVAVSGGTFEGNLFAGGNYATVYGTADMDISGSPTVNGDIYGGNDRNGTVTGVGRSGLSSTPTVTLGTATGLSSAVYSDAELQGNAIALTAANAATYVKIGGTPTINGTVYGGGNGHYDYNGTTTTDAPDINSCSTDVPEQFSSFVDINMTTDGANHGEIEQVFAGGNSANNGVSSLGSGVPSVTVFVNNHSMQNHIGTIYGGNNRVDMQVLPRLLLLQGTVGTIYGGGNQGGMDGDATVSGETVGTYVGLASSTIEVADIYGGCNMADVAHGTFVYIENGAVTGNIYGGNDISGSVHGESFVTVNGAEGMVLDGNIYGGGNGNYDYVPEAGNTTFSVTRGSVTYTGITGRPYAAAAHDSIIGTNAYTLNGIVYGGGLAGDCGTTHVVVDAPNATLTDMIFGGGRGDLANIGNGCTSYNGYLDAGGQCTTKAHVGNVTTRAQLELIRMGTFGGGKIYGGGHNGDVADVELSMAVTQTTSITELYGGCLASNVTGTAHSVINGYTTTEDNDYIVESLYGGNDYSGRVENTMLEINSGRFFSVYGAGNGDYDYRNLLSITTPPTAAQQAEGFSPTPVDDRYWKFGANCQDTVPYSMNVEVTYNGGEFMHSVYGGGNMGLVGNRNMATNDMLRTASAATRADNIGLITVNIHGGNFHRHVFGGARGRTALEMRGRSYFGLAAYDEDGAGGREVGKNAADQNMGSQLAYATKIVNMDGGYIAFSLYGGSEAVDDGFPYECYDNTGYETHNPAEYAKTTMRPSSILNITGGTVNKSVYGGGYQGNIYGSVYVNVGAQAIEDSPVWGNTYGTGEGYTFNLATLKPTVRYNNMTTSNTDLHVVNTTPLTLGASVYGASDWGEAGDKAYFNTRGVFGGETNILVDGLNYNTSLTNPQTDKPEMNITYSIYGAGTSTEGGDMNSMITLRRYGDYDCPNPSRTLYSIQRADKVLLDSVFITLKGENDAFQSYITPSYTFCRIDTLIFRYDNIVMIESPAIYIGNLVSLETRDEAALTNFEQNGTYDKLQNTHWKVDNEDNGQFRTYPAEVGESVARNFYHGVEGDENSDCDNVDVCMKLPTLRGTADRPGNFNVLMMRNGSYMKVSPFVDANEDGMDDVSGYGAVYGHMFLLAQDNTKSYVYAREKLAASHANDGGFVSPCLNENVPDALVANNGDEISYLNVETGAGVTHPYRTWTVGSKQGKRSRHITLVANVNPDGILNFDIPVDMHDEVKVLDGGTGFAETTRTCPITEEDSLAFATATLELPPSTAGSFYLIHSVLIDQDNGGQLALLDQAYFNNRQSGEYEDEGIFSLDEANVIQNLTALTTASGGSDPNYTFGLTFSSHGNNNFNTETCWLDHSDLTGVTVPAERSFRVGATHYPCWPRSIISGSQYLVQNGGYISSGVANGTGVIPTIDFTLTYSKKLSKTIIRDVVFTMHEYDSTGNYIGPVDVTVTISTVIRDFADLEVPLLAMYNDGLYNEHVRKISIPASFKQRDLYLKAIKWYPNDNAATRNEIQNDPRGVRFQLQDTATTILDNNHFSLVMRPTEASSGNINSSLGWYNIEQNSRNMDLYKIAEQDYAESHPTENHFSHSSVPGTLNQNSLYDSKDYLNNGNDEELNADSTHLSKKMWYVGTLDGRTSASIDFQLNFDGMAVYDEHYDERSNAGPLGWVELTFYWVNTQDMITQLGGGNKSGEFKVKVKIRTRTDGDTIYVAPNETLTRMPIGGNSSNIVWGIGETPGEPDAVTDGFEIGTNGITLYSYEYQKVNRDGLNSTNIYSALTTDATNIRNHPEKYLQSMKAAMSIYQEGDVISVMEAMPVENSANPISIIGDDYNTIQIIRYSGNHYLFPTLGCANKGAMFDVRGDGYMTLRNVWLNGSGCTRTKEGTAVNTDHSRVRTYYIKIGDTYYYEQNYRTDTLLASQWPMTFVHGGGDVNFSQNVLQSNNFNSYNYSEANFGLMGETATGTPLGGMCGGAMAIRRDVDGKAPGIILGNSCKVYDNVVVDWNKATAGGTADKLPHNYGGGIYMDGGALTLGTGGKTTAMNISRNYYLGTDINASVTGLQTKTMHLLDGTDFSFEVYYLDTANQANAYTLSNVYLTRKTRTPMPENGDEVRVDGQSDVIYFLSDFTPDSRVGISKWFPGYIYNTEGELSRLNCTIPRDTIMVAMLGAGKSDASIVSNVYNNGVFFNDSAYFSLAAATPSSPSFLHNSPEVLYNDVAGHKDNVWVAAHQLVDPYVIYFQRCGSFNAGIKFAEPSSVNVGTEALPRIVHLPNYMEVDSISYRWNSDATCRVSTDSLFVRVSGGFFPYTYKWYDVSDTTWNSNDHSTVNNISDVPKTLVRSRETYGGNYISNFDVDLYTKYREAAQCDTLVQRDVNLGGDESKIYAFVVEVTDATGHCKVSQMARVKTVKVVDGEQYVDDRNFLFHGSDYAIPAAAATVDSSSFHDKANFTATPAAGTRSSYAALASATTINSPYEPRYLRLYRGYKVMPSIYPEAAFTGSHIGVTPMTGSGEYDVTKTTTENAITTSFCPGDEVTLTPTNVSSDYEYMAWSHDPMGTEVNTFVVKNSPEANRPVIYYAPNSYWYQVVTAKPAGYQVAYNGDVTITSAEGLAWLISTVNGYNGHNAETFRFNTITLDFDNVNMEAHKWTPVGNLTNHFEGTIKVADGKAGIISSLIVNESSIPNVGMFGHAERARISDLCLNNVFMKGPSYVGGLVGRAVSSTISGVQVPSTVLFGQYCIGGLAAQADNTVIRDVVIGSYDEATLTALGMNEPNPNAELLRMMGGAIYAGGVVGKGLADTIENWYAGRPNTDALTSVYYASGLGYTERAAFKSDGATVLRNGYGIANSSEAMNRVGGLVGRAEGIDISNCYAYGEMKYSNYGGGLVGYMGDDVNITNCYYVDGMSSDMVGYNSQELPVMKSTTFSGSGNQVLLTDRVDGYNNLTRALNKWVQAQNDTLLRTWRSDLDNENNGYPVFGDPDMIPVYDSMLATSCDQYEFDGLYFTESGHYIFHVVDSADYLDSTFTLMLTINYGDSIAVSDTVEWGDGYEGFGFSLSADQLTACNNDSNAAIYAMSFVDSLLNANGCDSVVTLTLYVVRSGVDLPEVVQQLGSVKVYPNPTRGIVHVEGEELQRVETFDASGKKVGETAAGGTHLTLDLQSQASGAYYLRVQTANGTVVKKVIKK